VKNRSALPFLSLFTSLSTLVCCALPALFVALGAGAVFAGIVAQVPGLIWMSEHKILLFAFGSVMLTAGGVGLYRARNLPCPLDPAQAQACDQARKFSKIVYAISVLIYVIGFVFAFGAPLFT